MIKEIKFTDKAIKQINHLLSTKDKGSFFRIAIKGGGCSGFQYDFSFNKSIEKNDLKFEGRDTFFLSNPEILDTNHRNRKIFRVKATS